MNVQMLKTSETFCRSCTPISNALELFWSCERVCGAFYQRTPESCENCTRDIHRMFCCIEKRSCVKCYDFSFKNEVTFSINSLVRLKLEFWVAIVSWQRFFTCMNTPNFQKTNLQRPLSLYQRRMARARLVKVYTLSLPAWDMCFKGRQSRKF